MRIEWGKVEKSKYMWMIFHTDFKYCIHGDSANTTEEAQTAANNRIKENYKAVPQIN